MIARIRLLIDKFRVEIPFWHSQSSSTNSTRKVFLMNFLLALSFFIKYFPRSVFRSLKGINAMSWGKKYIKTFLDCMPNWPNIGWRWGLNWSIDIVWQTSVVVGMWFQDDSERANCYHIASYAPFATKKDTLKMRQKYIQIH